MSRPKEVVLPRKYCRRRTSGSTEGGTIGFSSNEIEALVDSGDASVEVVGTRAKLGRHLAEGSV